MLSLCSNVLCLSDKKDIFMLDLPFSCLLPSVNLFWPCIFCISSFQFTFSLMLILFRRNFLCIPFVLFHSFSPSAQQTFLLGVFFILQANLKSEEFFSFSYISAPFFKPSVVSCLNICECKLYTSFLYISFIHLFCHTLCPSALSVTGWIYFIALLRKKTSNHLYVHSQSGCVSAQLLMLSPKQGGRG